MKYLFFVTTITLLISNFTSGQDRSNYELLWQISKENSPEKSYLFGTMHVKDDSAFQFPDALIPAIESTSVFALEIDPQEAGDEIVNSLGATETKNYFKEVLSEDEYRLLKERFFTINNVDLDSIPLQHPYTISSMLQEDISKPNDRRTFLDAYLYSIAYQYDKEIAGLEELQDQFPEAASITDDELREMVMYFIDYKQEEQDKYLEQLSAIYFEGDLKKIHHFINESRVNGDIMESRNIKMVKSMDSIMKTKTLFSAIGAAHLPGEDGVIQLLKDKGYQVNPVPATFLNKDEKFELVPNTKKWVSNNHPDLGYSVKTPSTGSTVPILESNALTNVIDLLSGNSFSYFGYDTNQRVYAEGFSVVEEMIKNQLSVEDTELVSRNSVKNGDFEVTEVFSTKQNKSSRLQIYYDGRYVYMFHVEGALGEMESAYVNAFFDSVETYKPEGDSKNWKTHTDRMGAFSVDVHGEIEDNSVITPSPEDEDIFYDLKLFKVVDIENQVINLMRYNDQPTGYYLQDQSLFEDEFETYFKNLGAIIEKPEKKILQGYETITYKILVSEKYSAVARVTFRGNRTYLQISQSLIPEREINLDYRFFNSFKFEPYVDASFNESILIDNKYTASFPGKVDKSDIIEYGNASEFEYTYNYQSKDTTSGGTYVLQQSRFKPYAKGTTKQEYLDDYMQQLLEHNDSITEEKNINIDGIKAKQVIIYNPSTSVKQNLTLLIHDNNLITLLSYLGDDEMNRAQLFIDNFKISKPKEKFDLTKSKSKQLFKGLKSKDSITFYKAEGAFDYYIFEPDDNDMLLKSLSHTFLDDDNSYGTKYHIIDELSTLNKEESVPKLVDFYDTETDANLKLHSLENLGAFTHPEAKKTFLDIIQNNAPSRPIESPYDIFYRIPEPAKFITENEAIVTELLANDNYRDKLVDIYTLNILNDSIYKNEVPAFKKELKTYFIEDAQKYVDTEARNTYPNINYSLMSNYLSIMRTDSIADPVVSKTLLTLAGGEGTEDWLEISALIDAIELQFEIPESTLNRRLESLYSRFEVMEALIENNKIDKIPESYLTSTSFAKLSLYNAIGNDYDYYPEILNYLGEVTHNGEQYHAYNYGMEEATDDLYLCIAKAKNIDLKDFVANETNITYDEVKDDWKSQVLETLKGE